MSRYGRRLTKDELIQAGITEITEDGEVYRGEVKLNPCRTGKQNYLAISIYDRDKEGNLIKIIPKNAKPGYYVYKTRVIGLHRAMWAWFYGEVPEGLVVDHVDNQHSKIEDYTLDNLQLLTPAENINKEKPNNNNRLIKCMLSKDRKWYEDRLNKYTALYEIAKAEGNAAEAHKQRTNIAQTKGRLRYYDKFKKEA